MYFKLVKTTGKYNILLLGLETCAFECLVFWCLFGN